MKLRWYLVLVVLILMVNPAWAQQSGESTQSTSPDINMRGWGPRIGLSDDPDQVVIGAQFNLGELIDNLRFQPDVQLGFGDDQTTIYATAAAYYRFKVDGNFTPYAGGGIGLGFVDRDLPATSSADDTEFEIGLKATGGIEWFLKNNKAIFVELSLGFSDIHDAQVVLGWMF